MAHYSCLFSLYFKIYNEKTMRSVLLPVKLSQMWKNPTVATPLWPLTGVLFWEMYWAMQTKTLHFERGAENVAWIAGRTLWQRDLPDCEIVSQTKCWKQNPLEHSGTDEQSLLEIQGRGPLCLAEYLKLKKEDALLLWLTSFHFRGCSERTEVSENDLREWMQRTDWNVKNT